MKDRLYFNNKIEMRKSPIHRWGVFAKDDIASGEILEEIPFLIVPMAKGEVSGLFLDYRFIKLNGIVVKLVYTRDLCKLLKMSAL